MKPILIALIVFLSSLTLEAQSFDVQNFNSTTGLQILENSNQFQAGRKILERSDGKLLFCGTYGNQTLSDFSKYQVVCMDQNGIRCSDFGTNGAINQNEHEVPTASILSSVFNFTVQEDDKVLIHGVKNREGRVVRLNQDGSLDTTFGNNGYIIYPSVANDTGRGLKSEIINLGVDGFIVLHNYSLPGSFMDLAIYKMDVDGNLDPNFGTGGILQPDFNTEDINSTMQLYDDNYFILSSMTSNFSMPFNLNSVVQKYDFTGTLDPTFGTNGSVNIPNSGLYQSIDVSDAGKIAIIGTGLRFYSGNSDSEVDVALLNGDGSFDTTFSQTGFNRYLFVAQRNHTAEDIAVQPDGKLIVMFEEGPLIFGDHSILHRLNLDGTLDTSFGINGSIPQYSVPFNYGSSGMFDILMMDNGTAFVTGRAQADTVRPSSYFLAIKLLIPDSVLSTAEEELTTIKLFPNPTSDALYFETNESIDQITLYDLQGRMIVSITDLPTSSINLKELNLDTGTYIVRIKTGDHTISRKVLYGN
jgi:uncharacterized delta-60 repeat protein